MRQKLLSRCLAAGLFAAAIVPATAEAEGAPMVIKLATATLNDAQHEWLKRFATMIDKDSNGRIKAQVFPASQLGSIPRMIEQTQFGSIQCWVGPPEFLSGVDMRYEVVSAPGLFKDIAHAHRALQDPAFDKAILALGANKGLKGVGIFVSAPESIISRKPVHDIAGFSGMKIRVLAAPMQMEQIRALGATPVPMSLGEVLPALQQGALDAVMGDTPVFTDLRYYSVAKYAVETEHALVSSIAVFSKKWFDGLPPDLQKIALTDAQKVTDNIYPFAYAEYTQSFKTWTSGGGTVIRFDPKEQAKMMALLEPVGGKVAAKTPGEKELWDLLQAAAKRTE